MVSQRTARRRKAQRAVSSMITPKPNGLSYTEQTVPGNYPWGGINYQELIKVSPVSYDDLQTMLDLDGQARGLFNLLRRPIQRNMQRASIESWKPNAGEQEAEFCFNNFMMPRQMGGTIIPFSRNIGQLCNAMVFGSSTFELVYDRPGSVVDDEYVRMQKLGYRDPRTVTYLVDEHGEFNGFRQRTNWRGMFINKVVDRANAAYFAIDEAEQPVYGKSMFLPAYFHFDKKHKLYYTTHLALAVGAIPPRVAKAKMTTSDADKRTFLEALGNLGTNAAMLVPEGFEILQKAIEVGNNGNLPFIDMIRHHDIEMAKSVVGQVLDIGLDTNGGGFSVGKNHMDMLIETLENTQQNMCDFYNYRIFPQLVQWNFGTTNYPRIKVPLFTSDMTDMLVDIFSKVLNARQPNLSPEFMSELEKSMAKELGMNIDEEAIDQASANRIMQEQVQQAMDQANAAMGKHLSSMTVDEIVRDPKFLKFAEKNSLKLRKMMRNAQIVLDPDWEEEFSVC